MTINYLNNDYTIDLKAKTENQGRNSSQVKFEVSASIEHIETRTNINQNFYTQSMNTYNKQTTSGEDSEAYVFFGRSVAIVNSSKILIGAPHKTHTGHLGTPGDVGSVFEYTFTPGVTDSKGSQWVEKVEISGNLSLMDTQKRMYFGTALAATGSYVAVGAPGLDGEPGNQASNNGAVFIFKSSSSGYTEEDIFRPADTSSNAQYFGSVLTFDRNSNRLAVNGQNMENVYIFSSSSLGWEREAILTSSLITYNSSDFGHSLALSGTYLAVGAPLSRQDSFLDEGSVSIFKSSSSGWSEIVNVTSSNPVARGYFGLSLSILSNKRIVVGEPQGHPSVNKTGSVAIISFDDSGGKTILQTIENPRDNNYGSFGRNISSYEDGEFIIISRPLPNDDGTDSGNAEGHRALFVYQLSGSNNWSLSGTLTRDQSLATYYASTPGDWFYGSDLAKTGFHVPLDAKDGVVLLGVEDATDNTFRSDSPFNYSLGEFRAWRTLVTSSISIEEVTYDSTVVGETTVANFVPFRFHQNGPVNLRSQSNSKGYETFLGDQKS